MPQLELEDVVEITCGTNDHVNELDTKLVLWRGEILKFIQHVVIQ
jgi:hypothetical protein